jgi:hypothetical protein
VHLALVRCLLHGFVPCAEFKMTSKSKDWSDTVQIDDVSTANGGSGGCNKYDVSSLLADAPLDSIRQKINVEREEEVVEGPLPASDEALLNTDVVSEKVDLDLTGGQVRCLFMKIACFAVVIDASSRMKSD